MKILIKLLKKAVVINPHKRRFYTRYNLVKKLNFDINPLKENHGKNNRQK